MDFKKINESFDRYKEKKSTARDLVRYLHYEEGFSLREVLNLCAPMLGDDYDEDLFFEEVTDIAFNELPYGGYIGEDGITVIYGSEETC